MRIAVVAPVWFPVPPTGYGGIELVVSLLADGLVDAGHDVTLFASGGSHSKAKVVSPMAEPPDPRELGNPWYDAFHALVVLPPGRRLRRRARPRRDRRADLRRDAARAPAGRAHVARTVDRRRRGCFYGLVGQHVHLVADQRRATRRQPRRAVPRAPCTTASTSTSYPYREDKDDVLVYIGRVESRQGPEGSDHDRAPRRAAAADDPQAQRAARTRVLRARDRAAARERHRAATRTSRTKRRSTCSAARAR